MSPGSHRLTIVLTAGALAAVVWGALSFGAVYPWAYTPLAVLCATVGGVALVVRRRRGPSVSGLAAWLGAVGCAIAIQLAPFPAPISARLSPRFDTFVGDADGAVDAGRAAAAHALSIAPQKTALALTLFAAFALFFLGTTKLMSGVGARPVVRVLVGFGAVLALIGILQYVLTNGAAEELLIYGFWRPQYQARPFGPFVNRNHFAGWTIMVLPLAFGGAQSAWEAGRSLATGSIRDRVTWLSSPSGAGTLLMCLAIAVMGLALVMCESRSGMAGFAFGALVFATVVVRRQSTRRAQVAAAIVFASVLLVVAAWAGVDRVGARVTSVRADASSAGGRRQVWIDTTRIIRDFPLTGTGLDTFGTAMMVYQSERDLHFQEAHNDYLQLAAEGGLLVGVPVLVTIVVFAGQVRRRFAEAPKTGSTYWLRVGAVVGLLSIAMQALVEFSLQMPGNAALFAVLAAVAVHQSPNLRDAHADRRRQPA